LESVCALLMHRGSAAAAKDTAGAAKAQAIVFKVDHDNYYLNAQALQSVRSICAWRRETQREEAGSGLDGIWLFVRIWCTWVVLIAMCIFMIIDPR
jgi:hypothetical protein